MEDDAASPIQILIDYNSFLSLRLQKLLQFEVEIKYIERISSIYGKNSYGC